MSACAHVRIRSCIGHACRNRPQVSAKPLPVPKFSPQTLPRTIPVPTDEGIGPIEQIHVPPPLITGVA